MTHFQILKKASLFEWLSSETQIKLSKIPFLPSEPVPSPAKLPLFQSHRTLHITKPSLMESNTIPKSQNATKISRSALTEAQAALRDYLHCTRSLQFTDAEHMSKNSPTFLQSLLQKVDNKQEMGRSLSRFLRYHPINEFEPFFESLGLKPSELSGLLPPKLMFLSDDDLLLENVRFLCNYGVPRSNVGKMYKEATEIFRYDYGVLSSKIRGYEELGLNRRSVIKLVVANPRILIGDVNREFVEVCEKLKSLGVECDLIGDHLSEKSSYDWSKILEVLSRFSEMGYSREELGVLFSKHPGFLLDSSGKAAYSLIGILMKSGLTMIEIRRLFLQFPEVHVGTFVKNLRQSLSFLVAVEMETEAIQKIMHSHPHILGMYWVKRPNSVLAELNVGKRRLCSIIEKDPNQLWNWVLGTKISPLPSNDDNKVALKHKSVFLLSLDFIENSNEMKRALKLFRGKGDQLEERFNCLVNAGLSRNDVANMVKTAPQILNQSKEVIESKIDLLVNGLGIPVEKLVSFPSFVSYNVDRVNLRYSMYKWLRDEGTASPSLSLSTILACSEKAFVKQYVNHHPKGPEVWERLKEASSSH